MVHHQQQPVAVLRPLKDSGTVSDCCFLSSSGNLIKSSVNFAGSQGQASKSTTQSVISSSQFE